MYTSDPIVNAKIAINQWVRLPARKLTAPYRKLPDAIIAGESKCGTTSLYNYIVQHDNVARAVGQETHYFERHFERSINWYKAHFPLTIQNKIAIESTPMYYMNPNVPRRIATTVPNVRIILLFRNPVNRAISHVKHLKRLGWLDQSPEQVLEDELEWAQNNWPKTTHINDYLDQSYKHSSILMCGRYVERLSRWQQHFNDTRMLILRSEDLFSDPDPVMRLVFSFLNLGVNKSQTQTIYNKGENEVKISSTIKKRLYDYYRPYNKRLFKRLNWPMDTWC